MEGQNNFINSQKKSSTILNDLIKTTHKNSELNETD